MWYIFISFHVPYHCLSYSSWTSYHACDNHHFSWTVFACLSTCIIVNIFPSYRFKYHTLFPTIATYKSKYHISFISITHISHICTYTGVTHMLFIPIAHTYIYRFRYYSLFISIAHFNIYVIRFYSHINSHTYSISSYHNRFTSFIIDKNQHLSIIITNSHH